MILPAERREEWNALVARCPHGDVLQCWEWGELKSRTGWTPLAVAVERQGRLAAGCLVLKRPLPMGMSLLYAPRGPIVDFSSPGLWSELAEELRVVARPEKALFLKVDPAIPAEEERVAEVLRSEGFRPAASAETVGGTQPRQVMKLDLTPSEEDLLASFESKWRYNIRLAERKGVEVSGNCRREEVEVFYDLLKITAQRDGFTVRAISYFYDLWDLLVARGLGRLFLARVGGVPVAGTLAFILPPQAWYVYGASSNEHRSLMPNHALQWAMMRWAKAEGCTLYDFRGVAPERAGEAQGPLAGLNRFKRGFGARYVEYLGDYDLVFRPAGYWAFQELLPWVRARGRRKRAQEEV
ncbi:MAG: aminoacyltransferase [candidate division WS1 bacterium]|nr:aminoacyltransferase [candidate division WS1 bacterium]